MGNWAGNSAGVRRPLTGGRSGSAVDFVSPAGQPAEGAVDPLLHQESLHRRAAVVAVRLSGGPAALAPQSLTPGNSTDGGEARCSSLFRELALTALPRGVNKSSETSPIPSAPRGNIQETIRDCAILISWPWAMKKRTSTQTSGAWTEPSTSSGSATSNGGRAPEAAMTRAWTAQPATWQVPRWPASTSCCLWLESPERCQRLCRRWMVTSAR